MLPSDQQIEELHRRYAKTNEDFNLIYTHCQIIETTALQLLDAKPIDGIDRELVRIGCLLHDIGAYDVLEGGRFVEGIRHGTIGEEILKSEGFPEFIWRFASHHTGVGLTERDVKEQELPVPVMDYTATTNEERLVMYADKFHSKSNPPLEPPYFCTFDWFRSSVQKFGPDKAVTFDALANLFGKPDLNSLSRRFGHAVKDV